MYIYICKEILWLKPTYAYGVVARVGQRSGACRGLVGKPEEGDHLGVPGMGWRIILKWVLEKWDGGGGVWTGSIWFRIGAGSCECGNEPSVSIKCVEFLD
jgi:hypothetical protein